MNRTRDKVLTAAIAVLSRDGFRETTIEKIVTESGVARSTIYRHWETVSEIVMAAFSRELSYPVNTPNTGNIRTDLLAVYNQLIHAIEHSNWGDMFRSMVEAGLADEKFALLLRERSISRRDTLREVIRRAVERGELPPLTNVEEFLDPVVGAIYYRLLILNRKPIVDVGTLEYWVNQAVDFAIMRAEHD